MRVPAIQTRSHGDYGFSVQVYDAVSWTESVALAKAFEEDLPSLFQKWLLERKASEKSQAQKELEEKLDRVLEELRALSGLVRR